MKSSRNRRRLIGALACGLVALGPWMPAEAGSSALPEPVPGSCKLHQNHVVNPGCAPSLNEAVEEYEHTYPDLVPDVTLVYVQRPVLAWDPETETFVFGDPVLWFDTFSQNLGTVAVDIQSDDLTNVTNPPASQCVAWKPDRICRERLPVGGFELHPAHGHMHFQDFAAYEVRRLTTGGTPDMTSAGLVGASEKVSFCLIDSVQVRPDAFPVPTYNTCTGTREGITAGWADIYTSDLEGQQIELGALPDGQYALIIAMNSAQNVYESSYANNRLVVTVELSNMSSETPSAAIVSRTWS